MNFIEKLFFVSIFCKSCLFAPDLHRQLTPRGSHHDVSVQTDNADSEYPTFLSLKQIRFIEKMQAVHNEMRHRGLVQ